MSDYNPARALRKLAERMGFEVDEESEAEFDALAAHFDEQGHAAQQPDPEPHLGQLGKDALENIREAADRITAARFGEAEEDGFVSIDLNKHPDLEAIRREKVKRQSSRAADEDDLAITAMLTDDHIKTALAFLNCKWASVEDVRKRPRLHSSTILYAKTIAANEALAAENARLRAKYEPAPDPVKVAVNQLMRKACYLSTEEALEAGIRRGIEMQQPFTREEAERIARALDRKHWLKSDVLLAALTTPRDELAKMGEG